MSTWLQVGIVGKPHGLNGAFFVSGRDELFPKNYKNLVIGDDISSGQKVEVLTNKIHKNRTTLTLKGFTDRTAVDQIVGLTIWIDEKDIKVYDDEYLWEEIIGAKIVDPEENLIGEIAEVANYGASDVIEIHDDKGRILTVPFIKEYFDMSFAPAPEKIFTIVEASTFDELWQEAPKPK